MAFCLLLVVATLLISTPTLTLFVVYTVGVHGFSLKTKIIHTQHKQDQQQPYKQQDVAALLRHCVILRTQSMKRKSIKLQNDEEDEEDGNSHTDSNTNNDSNLDLKKDRRRIGRRNVEMALWDGTTKLMMSLDDKNVDENYDNNKQDDPWTAKVTIQPLPSNHLPDEISILNVYGIKVIRPLEKMIIHHNSSTSSSSRAHPRTRRDSNFQNQNWTSATSTGFVLQQIMEDNKVDNINNDADYDDDGEEEEEEEEGEEESDNDLFGFVAYKPSLDTYIGSIGCAVRVLFQVPPESTSTGSLTSISGKSITEQQQQQQQQPTIVVCRGMFRFVVKDIIQTIPYTVAVVDELVDNDLEQEEIQKVQELSVFNDEDDDDDDDDDYDDDDDDNDNDNDGDLYYNMYAYLSGSELIQRTLHAMKAFVDLQYDKAFNTKRTLLEESILQDVVVDYDSSVSASPAAAAEVAFELENATKSSIERIAAILNLFITKTLVYDIITLNEQYYAIAFLAAEISNLSNTIRQQLLITTNPIHRMYIVLYQLETILNMEHAKKIAFNITNTLDEQKKDLIVGIPTLPTWSKYIAKGTRIEYYWNIDSGWCSGTVIKDPVSNSVNEQGEVVGEVLHVTVLFDDDYSIHTIPFHPNEKVRWRPCT